MSRSTTIAIVLCTLALLFGTQPSPTATAATTIVGTGTPASCSESALRSALAGGGSISFNCGGPASIRITALIEIAADTSIDGGGLITLDGAGTARIFYVNKWERRNGTLLELRNISLINGVASGSLDPGYGGCIYARRSLTRLTNVTMRGCEASARGGAVNAYGGELIVSGGSYSENRANNGGALHVDNGGSISVAGASFSANRARGDGGAIYNGYSLLSVSGASFVGNVAEGTTGRPYAGLGGAIYLNGRGAEAEVVDSSFSENQAGESGGAIFADYNTVTVVSGSSFSQNRALPAVAGSYGSGGAIGTAGSQLMLLDSELRGNRAIDGGAVFNGKGSQMHIGRSQIIGNSGDSNGGGIYNIGGSLTVIESQISDNSAGTSSRSGRQGGGIVIYSNSQVTIRSSTVSGNRVIGGDGAGGGIFVSNASLTVESSTIAANSAVRGGGLWYNSGSTSIVASTIANNQASGSGSAVGINSGAPSVSSSLLVGGGSPSLCNRPVKDAGQNLQYPGSSCGASIGTADPQVQPMANNGGRTPTMALAAGSPAVNQGGAGCPGYDQRGYRRSGACDIGAFEFDSAGPPNFTRRALLPFVRR